MGSGTVGVRMPVDWTIIRNDLCNDRRLYEIARRLSWEEADTVLGKLFRFWAWAGVQSADGRLPGVTLGQIDIIVGCPGFASAMVAVGWLQEVRGGVLIPEFDRWLSPEAKARRGHALRQRLTRQKSDGEVRSNVATRVAMGEPTSSLRQSDRNPSARTPSPPSASPNPADAREEVRAGDLNVCLPEGEDARAVLRALRINEPALSRLAAVVPAEEVRWAWKRIIEGGQARDPRAVLVTCLMNWYGLERGCGRRLDPDARSFLDKIDKLRAARGIGSSVL